MFGWWRRRRRRKLLAQPMPEAWSGWIESLPFTRRLSAEERARLGDIARVLVAEKHWEGCGGLTLTEEMQVKLAAQAALLILNVDHEYYRDAESIFIYPGAYRNPHERHLESGVVGAGSVNLGEAWYRGPVVLSWADAERGWTNQNDGRNVVLHEFAHKLDFLDGLGDGTPPLPDRVGYDSWKKVMTRVFEGLRDAEEEGRATLLDKYGATNPAEFFAVATECFFEKPGPLRNRHPELYEQLANYYRQDPATSDDNDS